MNHVRRAPGEEKPETRPEAEAQEFPGPGDGSVGMTRQDNPFHIEIRVNRCR